MERNKERNPLVDLIILVLSLIFIALPICAFVSLVPGCEDIGEWFAKTGLSLEEIIDTWDFGELFGWFILNGIIAFLWGVMFNCGISMMAYVAYNV